MASVSN